MPVKKCCDYIGLVTVNVAGFPAAHKVTQQSFRDFRIRIWSERLAEHGRRDGHVQQVQPAIHPSKRGGQVASRAQRLFVEAARNRDVSPTRLPHQLLVEALHSRQNRQLKSDVFGQETSPRARLSPIISARSLLMFK